MKPSATFRFYVDDGEYREVHISEYDRGLPDGEFTDRHYQWLAAHWGLGDLFGWDLTVAVWNESGRRKPCRVCRAAHRLSVDPYRCDSCFLRDVTALHRSAARERRAAARRRDARRAVGALSPARRRHLELSLAGPLSSSGEVYAEAYDEVIS